MDIPWKFMLCTTLLLQLHVLQAQQTYLNNDQLDCYNGINYTRGFVCNGVESSCSAYLTFRSNPPYTSPVTIGSLLGVQPQLISNLNNLTNFATIPIDEQIIIPINCSCSGTYYNHNSSCKLMTEDENYYTVANITYQGLTTCRAMMDANPYEGHHLRMGMNLKVPLWCACATANQSANGARYLVTYMVTWGQTISSIAQMFGVDTQSIFDANELSSDLIFPFTPLLVPIKTEATKIQYPVNPPPPARSPPSPIDTVEESHSSNKWVFVGAGIRAALLILVTLFGVLFYCFHRRSSNKEVSQDVSLQEEVSIQFSIESLTLYKFEDLQRATEFFSEANRKRGAVYRRSIKADTAAIKMMTGDVSEEIKILKQINHTNIIRLSGFCVHDMNTYLVYEYAENGSLSDRLHLNHKGFTPLSWKQRVQIAYDIADGLNYLHNYTNPPYVHKNLKTSNIVLDGNFRAKISNFGLARAVGDEEEEGGFQLTRHVVGTQGYMAPEYIEHGAITLKLDVFAFGVVILELLSGQEALGGGDKNGGEMLSQSIIEVLIGDNKRERLQTFIDPSLGTEYPLDLAFSMAELAKNCVNHDLISRFNMSEVFLVLTKILSSSIEWDFSGESELSTIPSN